MSKFQRRQKFQKPTVRFHQTQFAIPQTVQVNHALVVQMHLLDFHTEFLLLSFCLFSPPVDIARFGSASKATHKLAEEGYLWKGVLKRKYPLSDLNPSSMHDWRLCYLLELNKIVDKNRCSVTRASFMEDILGIPIVYTINPKTNRVDYIHSSMDLLSRKAVKEQKVRTDVWGQAFELWLPLFFTDSHFQKALPDIKKTMVALCPDWKSSHFHPEMVLDVLTKLFNTFTVLVSDEGLASSKKSYQGYTALHRLFLALVHEFPSLQKAVDRRLGAFIQKEANRHKDEEPALGNLVPLLLVSDKYKWRDLATAYLNECFDRSVLWICKHNPKLEQVAGPNGDPKTDQRANERIKDSFEATRVSLRLLMLNVYFVSSHCIGSTQDIAHRYDRFFSQPEPCSLDSTVEQASAVELTEVTNKKNESKSDTAKSPNFESFCASVKGILSVDNFPTVFHAIGMKCPAKPAFITWLRTSVKNSQRRGYHKKGMDFGRVHASGVSQILKKGQQYSADNNLEGVMFTDNWGWKTSQIYLDASCLLYTGSKLVHTVDFSHLTAPGVTHSGDVITAVGGTHTIGIQLSALPAAVDSLVFVISAWGSAKLVDMVKPNVVFSNSQTAHELCRYDLESHNKTEHTAVVMCKLYRTGSSWHVLAIGDSCNGRAGSYAPIEKAIQNYL